MIFADAWTGGAIGGTFAAGFFVLCALIAIAWGIRDTYDGVPAIVAGLVVVVITAGAWFFSMWPLSYEYHHWIDKRVQVTDKSSRLLSDGNGGVNQKIVIRDSKGTYYGIDDTRAALAKEGDTLVLRCKRAYDYGVPRSSHGWDCKWNGVTS